VTIEAIVYVCPSCLKVGREHDTCAHYVGGSVGTLWVTRMPAKVVVSPVDWKPRPVESAPVIP
jgi:hypothetical protein